MTPMDAQQSQDESVGRFLRQNLRFGLTVTGGTLLAILGVLNLRVSGPRDDARQLTEAINHLEVVLERQRVADSVQSEQLALTLQLVLKNAAVTCRLDQDAALLAGLPCYSHPTEAAPRVRPPRVVP